LYKLCLIRVNVPLFVRQYYFPGTISDWHRLPQSIVEKVDWLRHSRLFVVFSTSVSIAISSSWASEGFQVSTCNCNFNILASNHMENTWAMTMTTSIPVQLTTVRLLYLCICIYLMYPWQCTCRRTNEINLQVYWYYIYWTCQLHCRI
jgi:hypothetical protein